MYTSFFLGTIFSALICAPHTEALENGLARTPPMGWMSWGRFGCQTDCDAYPRDCISEDLFMRMADSLVSEGYARAGYKYVIVDDCWLEPKRDKRTRKLVASRRRFPSGLNALANYLHTRNLYFGLYQNYGMTTCMSDYPGVLHHLHLDAQTFANWQVDYVKLDGCFTPTFLLADGFSKFGRLLNRTGRPMVFSCSWPAYQEYQNRKPNYKRASQHCNLWRNYKDIGDSYESILEIMDFIAENQNRFQPFAGPGHWNDPDMLMLGNFGLNYEQSRLQMAIWAILAAPLIMSNDLATVRPEIKAILQNRAIIAINQDALGQQGRLVTRQHGIELWVRAVLPLSQDKRFSYAVAFVNRRTDGQPYASSIDLSRFGLNNTNGYIVKNLFDNSQILGIYKPADLFKTTVNSSGVTFYKFTLRNEWFSRFASNKLPKVD